MRAGMKIALGLFVFGIALMLIQLWFTPWSAEMFIKLLVTVGALFVVALVVTMVNKEAHELDKLKHGEDNLD